MDILPEKNWNIYISSYCYCLVLHASLIFSECQWWEGKEPETLDQVPATVPGTVLAVFCRFSWWPQEPGILLPSLMHHCNHLPLADFASSLAFSSHPHSIHSPNSNQKDPVECRFGHNLPLFQTLWVLFVSLGIKDSWTELKESSWSGLRFLPQPQHGPFSHPTSKCSSVPCSLLTATHNTWLAPRLSSHPPPPPHTAQDGLQDSKGHVYVFTNQYISNWFLETEPQRA